jgi:hypothetical protein
MPWYWTDDLARTLIDSGKADRVTVAGWIVSPVAVRSDEDSAETVAASLLNDEPDDPSRPVALAA